MYKKNKERHLFVAHQVRITRAKNALIISPVNPLSANQPIMSICASTQHDFCNKMVHHDKYVDCWLHEYLMPRSRKLENCADTVILFKKISPKSCTCLAFVSPITSNITKVPFVAEMSRATSGNRVYLRCTFAACRRSYSICLAEHIEKRNLHRHTEAYYKKIQFMIWFESMPTFSS